jgi:hypothetical protein
VGEGGADCVGEGGRDIDGLEEFFCGLDGSEAVSNRHLGDVVNQFFGGLVWRLFGRGGSGDGQRRGVRGQVS